MPYYRHSYLVVHLLTYSGFLLNFRVFSYQKFNSRLFVYDKIWTNFVFLKGNQLLKCKFWSHGEVLQSNEFDVNWISVFFPSVLKTS